MREWFKKHDLITKILSVFAAVILWSYIMSIQNPTRTLEYRDISVQLSGVDELFNTYNLQVIHGADATVNVRVSGASSRLATLTASQIKVKADLTEAITSAGTYEVAYRVILPESGMTCVSSSPDTITLEVDRVDTKSVPVSVELSNDAPDGYLFEDPELSVKNVKLTGPESEMNAITSAVISVDTSNLKKTVTDYYTYTLVDKDGNSVSSANISRSVGGISVTIPVKQIKSVPLEVSFSPEDDTTDISASISPSSVEIVGDPDTVSGINSIAIGAINTTTAQNGDSFDFSINAPTGVQLKDGEPTTATVTVTIHDNIEKKFTITDISLNDIKKDETAEVKLETESLEVTLSGSQKLLDTVTENDMKAVAEIASADLSEGQHTIGATITSPDGATVIGTYSVTVSITKQAKEPESTDTEPTDTDTGSVNTE